MAALTRTISGEVASTGRISTMSFAVGVVPDNFPSSSWEEERARIWRRIRRMSVPGYPVFLDTKLPNLVVRKDSELKLAIWANDIEVSQDEVYFQWYFHGWEQQFQI